MKDTSLRRQIVKQFTNVLVAATVCVLCVLLWPPQRYHWPLATGLYNAERLGYDAMFALRGPIPEKVDPRIVIVGFEDEAEYPWPPPRAVHAKVIENLIKDGAALVCYDVLFSGPSPHGRDDDLALDRVLKLYGNKVILTSRLNRSYSKMQVSYEGPYHEDNPDGIDFEAKAASGLAEIPQDDDDVVRWLMPFEWFQGDKEPTLATAAYLRLMGLKPEDIVVTKGAIQMGDLKIPRASFSAWENVYKKEIPLAIPDFSAGLRSFPLDVEFSTAARKEFAPGSFKGKIVFVGITNYQLRKELREEYATSYSNLRPEEVNANTSSKMPGVMVQAHSLNVLLQNTFVREVPDWAFGFVTFLLAMAGLSIARYYYNWRGPVFLLILAITFGLISGLVFQKTNYHLPWVVPDLLMLISAYGIAWAERSALKRRWQGYVSPEVLEHILRHGGDEAKRFEASVVFGDVRGFTAFTAAHTPELVIKLLNHHFEKMIAIIRAEKGTVDKFLGDGIIALFGCPIPGEENEAVSATRAAWFMCQASKEAVSEEGKEFHLASGFGVTTGAFVAGHVGSKKLHNFTIIGETVNIAARLQGITGQADVIIDQRTYEQVKDFVNVEPLGAVELKGEPEPIPCYKVTDWHEGRPGEKASSKELE